MRPGSGILAGRSDASAEKDRLLMARTRPSSCSASSSLTQLFVKSARPEERRLQDPFRAGKEKARK